MKQSIALVLISLVLIWLFLVNNPIYAMQSHKAKWKAIPICKPAAPGVLATHHETEGNVSATKSKCA